MNTAELEKLLLSRGPDDTVDPTLFTASVGEGHVSVTLPLGMDYRFCRGMSIVFGKSAVGELTLQLKEDLDSNYRPGMVNLQDSMCIIPTRKVQIPILKCSPPSTGVSRFRRTRAAKVFIQRDGSILLTMPLSVLN